MPGAPDHGSTSPSGSPAFEKKINTRRSRSLVTGPSRGENRRPQDGAVRNQMHDAIMRKGEQWREHSCDGFFTNRKNPLKCSISAAIPHSKHLDYGELRRRPNQAKPTCSGQSQVVSEEEWLCERRDEFIREGTSAWAKTLCLSTEP